MAEKVRIKNQVEAQVKLQVIDNELVVGITNNQEKTDEFESYVDMLDGIRTEKKYDWMSDINIPEFAAHMLTQSSVDANIYFQTRDYVEAFVQDKNEEAILSANAQKELINKTLNQNHLNHYSKYMRSKILANISGRAYFRCWWEKTSKQVQTGTKEVQEGNDADNRVRIEPVFESIADKDRFNYDVIDQRNIFMDNTYTYSLQDKKWIIIRSEITLNDLEQLENQRKYFNIKDIGVKQNSGGETETSQESYNKLKEEVTLSTKVSPTIDLFERFGEYWVKVTKSDPETNEPLEIDIGIDESGKPLKGAILLETIITFAKHQGENTLIGFQLTPYINSLGDPYKPIIRGLNYIHPTIDGGVGDGQYARDLQLGINDTFNMGNDRVSLATFPTLKVAKHKNADNPTIHIAPGHNIELEDPNDVQELIISDNINGALQQVNMLTNQMDKTTSIFPTTQGQLPTNASTTATAIAGAEQRSNQRGNYRSLTFEFTALVELYNMITQMTWRFASQETGLKLMGDKAINFDPTRADYSYKPLSQSIETESSKSSKLNKYDLMLQRVIQILPVTKDPQIIQLMNKIISKQFELLGDEFDSFSDVLLNPQQPIQGTPGKQGEGGQEPVPSNQSGVPQEQDQIDAREVAPQ